jgi:glyoxylase-like metal-dependent hydrolase (beta-lactamase superfamily II)
MATLARFLGERLAGTRPLPATTCLEGDYVTVQRGGATLVLSYTDAHFPGDAMVWLPAQRVVFSGDLVFVDRLAGILPWSSVAHSKQAFAALVALQPARIVPGHGRVCDLAQAQRESGDYYEFLASVIGAAAKDMQPMSEVLDRHMDLPAFRHLENYAGLHRANMNRSFVEYEGQ